ncbi:hypothetical protein GJ496_003706 [Pomphorhynchus laevis]|nr:hypothetical protein GJ496_003706 [Pomphorhynchus laevis]
MDFRLLNSYISSHTADSDVCISKLRNWRRWGDRLSLIDLRRAYLQIHVDESLWPYQVVVYRNKRYVLTRLGFGLNIAPRILKAIVHFVLSKDMLVAQSTDSYLDDIIVDNTKIANDNVLKLLAKFGLEAKQPVDIHSATVYSWICSTLYDERNVCVKGLSDMLIKRRLRMLKEIQTEFSLSITVKLIPSSQKKGPFNKKGLCDSSIPHNQIYKYKSKLPWERIENRESSSSVSEFSTVDQVFMRPAVCRCDKPWIQGNVTGINSNTSINVDGVLHHISHLRRCPYDNNTPTASSTG